jgi:hypothetical protein
VLGIALAFLAGAICGLVIGVLVGAVVADTLALRRTHRRRAAVDVHGADALESWLTGIDWPARQPTNGHPFQEGEIA